MRIAGRNVGFFALGIIGLAMTGIWWAKRAASQEQPGMLRTQPGQGLSRPDQAQRRSGSGFSNQKVLPPSRIPQVNNVGAREQAALTRQPVVVKNRPTFRQAGPRYGIQHRRPANSRSNSTSTISAYGRSVVGQPAHGVNSQQSVVRHAHSSVTHRSRATANDWRGPRQQPIRPIQRTSFKKEVPELFEFQDTTPEELISPYANRAVAYPDSEQPLPVEGQPKALPADYVPWWDAIVNRRMRPAQPALNVNVDSLILKAVEHSPQVIAMRIDPVIRETAIIEEEAEFDWTTFLETTFDDNNDPIGNTLTAGQNVNRYEDRNWTASAGLRKRLNQGGQLDVSQRIGIQNTNSQFFAPDPQGTARLELNFTQPLMRGSGTVYNESRIVLAAVDRQAAEADLSMNLQDHLVAVYETYWQLYQTRAVRLQKEKLLQRALVIQKHLEARQAVDTTQRQVLRARAAVASRRSEIVRADMAIRNAESRLRLLVNSPELKGQVRQEMLPGELPMAAHLDVSLRASVETALQHRPEIARAIRDMNSTSVRLGIARNELLPKLDLLMGVYVAGLKGGGKVWHSYTKQFSEGRPGYGFGLMLEYPLGNRAARARHERRQWEVAKAFRNFEAAVETGMTDVELAVRELETAWQEVLSRFQSMLAAETEATWLFERWRRLPGNDQTVSFLLEDLLDAQKRVADEEAEFVKARVAYVVAIVKLKRATGVLLDFDASGLGELPPPSRPSTTEPETVPSPVNLPPPGEAPVPVPK